MNNQKYEIKISQQLKQKVDAAKEYIESKYSKMKKEQEDKIQNWNMFEERVNDLRLTQQEKQRLIQQIAMKESQLLRKKRSKISSHDFESLAVIGKGAFGEVRLCRQISTGEVVAIKRLKKKQMVKKNQVAHIRAERNVLVHGNPWIVSLKYSFQDQIYLYLVMEFLQGGDLMTLLIKKNILLEEEARFYIMEMILAIQSVHKMNYIHRDLKPDNILLDDKGHVKLSDFGLCKQAEIRKSQPKKLNHKESQFVIPKPENYLKNLYEIKKKNFKNRNRQLAYSAVGTPDYIAPEMLRQSGYTETVDWWSIGVILYEMLVGYAPFSSDSNEQIYYKIQHHDEYLVFPSEIELSDQVVNLIQRLVCQDYERLGRNGVDQIKSHPWFKNVNWKKISQTKAPFIPELKNNTDISNFDHYDEEQPWEVQNKNNTKKDFNFIGYTFKQVDQNNQRSLMVSAIERLQRSQSSMFRKNVNKSKMPVIYDCQKTQNQQLSSRSKENPRDSFKQNSSKLLKNYIKGENKVVLKETTNLQNYSNIHPNKKQTTSKSPQLNNKKNPIPILNKANFNQKNPSPNFTMLINCMKQKQNIIPVKDKNITPQFLKLQKSHIEAKTQKYENNKVIKLKPPNMKFKDLK